MLFSSSSSSCCSKLLSLRVIILLLILCLIVTAFYRNSINLHQQQHKVDKNNNNNGSAVGTTSSGISLFSTTNNNIVALTTTTTSTTTRIDDDDDDDDHDNDTEKIIERQQEEVVIPEPAVVVPVRVTSTSNTTTTPPPPAQEADGADTDTDTDTVVNEEEVKFFGIGFKETGTTTLDAMFKQLQLLSQQQQQQLPPLPPNDERNNNNKHNNKVLSKPIPWLSPKDTSKVMKVADKYTYFQDKPWFVSDVYREVSKRYPTAKFILTVRSDPDQWWNSVHNWVHCKVRSNKRRVGTKKLQFYAKLFNANSTSKHDMIQSYIDHTNQVQQFFIHTPERLLLLDLTAASGGDGDDDATTIWAKLCNFMNVSKSACPTGDIPHSRGTPARCINNDTNNADIGTDTDTDTDTSSHNNNHLIINNTTNSTTLLLGGGGDDDDDKDDEDSTRDYYWDKLIKAPLKNGRVDIKSGETRKRFIHHAKNVRLPHHDEKDDEEENRYESFSLPPRLKLSDELRLEKLNSGVLMSAVGKAKYVQEQLIPMVEYYRTALGIPNAHERSLSRKHNNNNATTNPASEHGFALMTEQWMIDELLGPIVGFFDMVYTPADLADYPKGSDWKKYYSENLDAVKIVKVHTMASAPFDYTVMLDLDTIPQTSDFMRPLLKHMNGDTDIATTDKWSWMDKVPANNYRHWWGEHNSALMLMNMTSSRTRVLLGLYIQVFHSNPKNEEYDPFHFQKQGLPRGQRDQPSLLVAMLAMATQLHNSPLYSNAMVADLEGLGGLQHVDLPYQAFCRGKNTPPKFPLKSCLFAHKCRCDGLSKCPENPTFHQGRIAWKG